jgi:hypothetical protein
LKSLSITSISILLALSAIFLASSAKAAPICSSIFFDSYSDVSRSLIEFNLKSGRNYPRLPAISSREEWDEFFKKTAAYLENNKGQMLFFEILDLKDRINEIAKNLSPEVLKIAQRRKTLPEVLVLEFIASGSNKTELPVFKFWNHHYPGRVRQIAASAFARLWEKSHPISDPRAKFEFEVALLGLHPEVVPLVYRFDFRSPNELRLAGGFQRKDSIFVYPEHTHPLTNSGSFVSTTLNAESEHVRALLSGYRGPVPNPSGAKYPVEFYIYEMTNVSGVRTPDIYGKPLEEEVVTDRITNDQIVAYRKLVVDRATNQVMDTTPWTAF